MATLTVQTISRAGVGPTYVAAGAGGDAFTPGSDTFLHVKNGGGGAIDVYVETPATVPGYDLALDPNYTSVPAGGERMIGPFPPDAFVDPTTGLTTNTYTGVTSVTVAAIKLGQP